MACQEPLSAACLMGLIVGAVLAASVWLVLWRTRGIGSAALQLVGAALLVGLAGYAMQGRVGLIGSPAAERPPHALPPAMTIPLADEFFGRFNGAYSWLAIANSFLARGNSGEAVATLAGVRTEREIGSGSSGTRLLLRTCCPPDGRCQRCPDRLERPAQKGSGRCTLGPGVKDANSSFERDTLTDCGGKKRQNPVGRR